MMCDPGGAPYVTRRRLACGGGNHDGPASGHGGFSGQESGWQLRPLIAAVGQLSSRMSLPVAGKRPDRRGKAYCTVHTYIHPHPRFLYDTVHHLLTVLAAVLYGLDVRYGSTIRSSASDSHACSRSPAGDEDENEKGRMGSTASQTKSN